MIQIPLTSDPEQLFSTVINGETFEVRVVLNSRRRLGNGAWTISFSQNDVPVIQGVTLFGGVDIVGQYNLPGLKNMYVINVDTPNTDPNKTGLGETSILVLLEDEEVPSV